VDFEIAFSNVKKATLKIPYSLEGFKEKVLNKMKKQRYGHERHPKGTSSGEVYPFRLQVQGVNPFPGGQSLINGSPNKLI